MITIMVADYLIDERLTEVERPYYRGFITVAGSVYEIDYEDHRVIDTDIWDRDNLITYHIDSSGCILRINAGYITYQQFEQIQRIKANDFYVEVYDMDNNNRIAERISGDYTTTINKLVKYVI